MVTKYNNAYTEVYVIINSLAKEDYNKIPVDMIHAIRENRNKNYRFAIDEHLNLKEQKLLPETKAILFNLFRDYLATKEQRDKILNFQQIERIHLEKKIGDYVTKQEVVAYVYANDEEKGKEAVENLKRAYEVL